MPESLVYLRKLEVLWLNDNRLTHLPELIGNLDWLKEFRVFNNQLKHLPVSIGKLTRLSELDVSNNHLEALPESIGHLRRMYQMRLSQNNLKKLPDSICELSGLNWLFLRQNQLTKLPEHLGKLQALQCIEADYNELTEIPASVQSMHGLRRLSLDNNPLNQDFELPYEAQFKSGSLPSIQLQFAQFFSFCGLVLPKDMVEKRCRGFVGDEEEVDQSFFVAHFCFGKDGDREYLDFYMCSQRTGDIYRRIYEDGEHQYLPVYAPGHRISKDPEENDRLVAGYHQYNAQVSADLEKKFGIS